MAGKQNLGAPDGSGSMAARRRLGRILAELREAKNITQEAAAEYIERAPSTLWKLEGGQPGVRIRIKQDINLLCELYEANEATRAGLASLAEATKVKGWYQPFRDVMPAEFDMYLGYEGDATAIRTYGTDLVPGLLQTEDYARALTRLPGADGRAREDVEIDKRVALRMERQGVLTRKPNPLALDVILAETVLRRSIGGTHVMAHQLRHVNELGKLLNVSIRVAPFAAGLHLGVTTGQFVILRLPDGEPPVVYADTTFLGDVYFKEPDEVARYEEAFADISNHALNSQKSRALIEQAAKELSPDG